MMRPWDLTLGRHPNERKALGTRMTISRDREYRRSLRHDSAGSLCSNIRIFIFEKRHQFAHCSYVHCLVFTFQRKTEEKKNRMSFFAIWLTVWWGGGLASLADCRTHIGHFRLDCEQSLFGQSRLSSAGLERANSRERGKRKCEAS